MHNTFNHHNTPFTLSSDMWTPSQLREVADQLVEVDYYMWKLATRYECVTTLARLEKMGVSVDSHEVVGDYYQDLTHWCDIEQKIEYCEDSRVLLAPSKTMKQFKVDYTFEDIAAELGYTEYAA